MNITITAQDHATILAALRYYQQEGMGEPDNRSDDIHDIATNGDAEISLDDEGIDDLCERLNVAEPERIACPADPTRALVLIEALADYGSGQWVQAKALRDGKMMTDHSAATREMFAQGCDARRRAADEMRQEMTS